MNILKKYNKNKIIINLSENFMKLVNENINYNLVNYEDFCNSLGILGNFIRGDTNLLKLYEIYKEEKKGNIKKSIELAKKFKLDKNFN